MQLVHARPFRSVEQSPAVASFSGPSHAKMFVESLYEYCDGRSRVYRIVLSIFSKYYPITVLHRNFLGFYAFVLSETSLTTFERRTYERFRLYWYYFNIKPKKVTLGKLFLKIWKLREVKPKLLSDTDISKSIYVPYQ